MSELIKFYKSLLEMLGLIVDNNGQVFIKMSESNYPVSVDGLNLYLPTDDNIKTSIEIVDGSPKVVKSLFNPFDESGIKGANKTFAKLKQIIELKLSGVFYQLGETLLSLIVNENDSSNNIGVIKFVSVVNKYKNSAKTIKIDEKSISNWANLYEHITSNGMKPKYIETLVKRGTKGGTIDNVKYNRIGVITFPFLEELKPIKANKEKFLNVKLRSGDVVVYTALFEFLFGDSEKLIDGLSFGSLNKLAPSSHVLLIMYNKVYEKLNTFLEALRDSEIDDDTKEHLLLNKLPIDISNLGDFIDSMEQEIKRIPKDNELTSNTVVNNTINVNGNATTSNTIASKAGNFWDKVAEQTNPAVSSMVAMTPVVNMQPNVNQYGMAAQTMTAPVYATPPEQMMPVVGQPATIIRTQPANAVANIMPMDNRLSIPSAGNIAHMVKSDPWETPQPQGTMLGGLNPYGQPMQMQPQMPTSSWDKF